MRSKFRIVEALRLIWIACLAADAYPANQIYGLDDVQESGDGRSERNNVPEPMMDFFQCDLDQKCLEGYGWPAEYPHTEYTVRSVIANGEGRCVAYECTMQYTKNYT